MLVVWFRASSRKFIFGDGKKMMKRKLLRKLMMVALFFLSVLLFTACGADTTQPEEYLPIEKPEVEAEPLLPGDYQIEPNLGRFMFEDGVLGIKISFDPSEWYIGDRDWRGSYASTLVTSTGRDNVWGDVWFEITEVSAPPSDWAVVYAGAWDHPGENARSVWQHPDTPDEVFTNDAGLTVVRYTSIYEQQRWNFEQQEHEYVERVTTIFFLRSDGRDYREVADAQIYYNILLDLPVALLDEYLPLARALANSIEFHEGATISLEPSEQADSLGITRINYPRIDGSTSASTLAGEIFKAMFEPSTRPHGTFGWYNWFPYSPQSGRLARTVPSYGLLITGEVDLIITPDPSPAVLQMARDAGVELEFIPIAVEALVFITHEDNPVSSITTEQVLQIYTDMSLTNWVQLGGQDGRIIPLNRNTHSGSQVLMDSLLLQGREIHPALDDYQIRGMMDMLGGVENPHWFYAEEYSWEPPEGPHETFTLGYTVYFFLQQAQREGWSANVKPLALDGVFPSHETILSGEYPLFANYFAVIRADTPPDDPARMIANWLLTPAGQAAVEAAGLGTLN